MTATATTTRREILVLATRSPTPAADVAFCKSLQVVADASVVFAAKAAAASHDWILFSSSNAVDAWFATGEAGLHGKLIGAVGAATAAALVAHGVEVALVGESGGEALAYALAEACPIATHKNTAVLIPRARDGRRELETQLARHGYRVTPMAVYHTVRDAAGVQAAVALLKTAEPRALAFASPAGVAALLASLPDLALLGGRIVGAIGDTTRAALQSANIRVDWMASKPTLDLLVDELRTLLRQHG